MSDAIDYIEQRTGRPWQFRPGSQTWETLRADCRDFGEPAVLAAMSGLAVTRPDVGQLVFGASRVLHPIEKPKPQRGHNVSAQEGDDAFAA